MLSLASYAFWLLLLKSGSQDWTRIVKIGLPYLLYGNILGVKYFAVGQRLRRCSANPPTAGSVPLRSQFHASGAIKMREKIEQASQVAVPVDVFTARQSASRASRKPGLYCLSENFDLQSKNPQVRGLALYSMFLPVPSVGARIAITPTRSLANRS